MCVCDYVDWCEGVRLSTPNISFSLSSLPPVGVPASSTLPQHTLHLLSFHPAFNTLCSLLHHLSTTAVQNMFSPCHRQSVAKIAPPNSNANTSTKVCMNCWPSCQNYPQRSKLLFRKSTTRSSRFPAPPAGQNGNYGHVHCFVTVALWEKEARVHGR